MEIWDSRSPRGERGLKYTKLYPKALALWSLPPRGAWIEIHKQKYGKIQNYGRSPRGERGLKSSGKVG